jgi:hypothetical protein
MSYEANKHTLEYFVREAVEDYLDHTEVSKEDKDRIASEIADSESFHQKLYDYIQDDIDFWMDELEIEKYPFTEEEEKKKEEFFEKGQFIVAPEYLKYAGNEPDNLSYLLWEDFEEARKFAEENPDIHVYTLLDADGHGVIVKGARWVNRFAYLLSVNDVGLSEDDEVRFW